MNKTLIFVLLGLVSFVACANYSVLVAGSKGYENYRHQADVCHAYQSLLKKGFQPENIIVFLYNDVANNKQNPFKGKLFNQPNGQDVYAGCKIDYQGNDVTPKNYMSVLTGDKQAVAKIGTGRVLESTSSDNVFLYFADHGAPGFVAFPTQKFYANDLISTFQKMHSKNMYNKLVYYLEACESGSMFVNLPTNLNIYALSAANPTESSYAAYCGSQAKVDGKNIGSCLGDLFSVNFIEEIDATSDLSALTLQQQFEYVAQKTTMSQVMQWGDLSYVSEPVADFLSAKSSASQSLKSALLGLFNFSSRPSMRRINQTEEEEDNDIHSHESFVDARKAKISTFLHQYIHTPSAENFEMLNVELHNDQKFQTFFDTIKMKKGDIVSNDVYATTDFACYKNLIEAFENKCGEVPESQYSGFRHLYDICGRAYFAAVDANELLNNVC
ncbi:peptidase C13 family protein (macronuclear) [Tetrahymena thermophila SB210]|uniref:legumain n=1 Tax=Tetrahymena thermophila (strain SB210) TaxID=312017 RepID=Q22P33_TETTS|nr:peptidase C13 family protein [Tetrahymena thermophila SB210]EAR86978.1 peptidase C13 family protein [Tetrahymena thermophila SB210]|eukprot:XP_001007223.1 peptidase C13 family protein [Tetrahymena thermophila SB210]